MNNKVDVFLEEVRWHPFSEVLDVAEEAQASGRFDVAHQLTRGAVLDYADLKYDASFIRAQKIFVESAPSVAEDLAQSRDAVGKVAQALLWSHAGSCCFCDGQASAVQKKLFSDILSAAEYHMGVRVMPALCLAEPDIFSDGKILVADAWRRLSKKYIRDESSEFVFKEMALLDALKICSDIEKPVSDVMKRLVLSDAIFLAKDSDSVAAAFNKVDLPVKQKIVKQVKVRGVKPL